MTPRCGVYDINVGNMNGSLLAKEEVDSRVLTDSSEKNFKVKDAAATF